jgi:hypothetical protein
MNVCLFSALDFPFILDGKFIGVFILSYESWNTDTGGLELLRLGLCPETSVPAKTVHKYQ